MAIQSECILVSVRCTYHMNKSLFDQWVVLGGVRKPLTVSIYICLLLDKASLYETTQLGFEPIRVIFPFRLLV